MFDFGLYTQVSDSGPHGPLVHICCGCPAINGSMIFPYDFSGIVAGYGLRHMCSHCMRASCEYLYGHLATCRAKPYGGCAKIVRKSCDAGAVAMQSPQIPHGNRTSLVRAVQRWCSDTARTVR